MQHVGYKFQSVHKTIHGDLSNLERILTTCDEMLRDRGCSQVCKAQNIPQAITRCEPVFTGTMRDRRIVDIYLCDDSKVGVKYARGVLDSSGDHDAIIVSLEGPTSFTRKECDRIQFMLAKDLCYNVTKHMLQPKHEVVAHPPPPLMSDQLPRILETDPLVQYYNWPLGTIVRFTRCYAGHEPIVYYRCVSSLNN